MVEDRKSLYNAMRKKGVHVVESLEDDYYIVSTGKIMRMPGGNNVFGRYKIFKEAKTIEDKVRAERKLIQMINTYREDPDMPWQPLEKFIELLDEENFRRLIEEYQAK